MYISDNSSSEQVSTKPKVKLEKQEYSEKLIALFKEFDKNGDKVLDSNDSTVKALEDILNGKVNDSYSYDEMAKYVILRNLAKGKEITLDNVSKRFEEVWQLCQEDEEAQKLIKQIDDLFQEYSIKIGEVDSAVAQSKADIDNYDSELEEKIKNSYENYCQELKNKNIEIKISFEEYRAEYFANFGEMNKNLKEIQQKSYDCKNLSNKIDIDERFLTKFGTSYTQLQLRIQTLEKKAIRERLQEANSNTPINNNTGPQFGL